MKRGRIRTAGYIALLAGAWTCAVLGSWKFFGAQVDNSAYDRMFRLYQPKPWMPQSAILAVDEGTLARFGGMRRIRQPLARALQLTAAAHPAALAVDVILTDEGNGAGEDATLASALCEAPNLVLSSLLIDNPLRWEDPKPDFRKCAAAVGHVHAEPDDNDNTTRSISLEKIAGHDRRWALALEAFRLSRAAPVIERQGRAALGDLQV